MPFTFSHPAAMLPLYKMGRWLSFSGLVMGSVTPDFEYFLRLKSRYSHSFIGALWFDLPMALLIAFLFFNIAKNPLVDNLPEFIRSRLGVLRAFNWNRYFKEHWLKVLISILIGIFSHLLWDSFTHQTGYFVQRFAVLEATIRSIPIYRVLQHISTLIGGLAVIWFVFRQPATEQPSKINPAYWLAVAGMTGLTAAVMLNGVTIRNLWYTVIILIASGLLALLIAPFIARVFPNT